MNLKTEKRNVQLSKLFKVKTALIHAQKITKEWQIKFADFTLLGAY